MMLLMLALLAGAADRLSDPVVPLHQHIRVTVDPAAPRFSGHVAIELDVQAKLSSFHLHGEDLDIQEVALVRGRKRVPATATAVDGGALRVDTSKSLKPGPWTLEVDYTAPVHDQPYGLYRFEHDGQPYLVSQFEADDARTAWPCFDEPGFKVPHSVTVIAPEGQTVVSNAPIDGVRPQGAGLETTFAATPAIPTYAAALAVGPYESLEVDGLSVPGRVYVPRGALSLAPAQAQEMRLALAALQDWFGSDYPYAKLDFIVASEFAFGAMENPGAVVIRQDLLFADAARTPARQESLAHVTAHEIAHMWFGNQVTMAWWDDFWLNESFTEWVSKKISRQVHPELADDVDRVRTRARMIRRDAGGTIDKLRTKVDPAAIFETANFAAYAKGEAVLDMVEAWLGPDVFQRGVRDYLAAHRGGNARDVDLFAALSQASGQDVGAVLSTFLDQPGVPEVIFERLPDGRFHLSQARLLSLGADASTDLAWKLPVRLRVGLADGETEVRTVLLGPDGVDVDLRDTAWVMPGADGIGYHAWRLPPEWVDRLVGATPSLSEAERLALLTGLQEQEAAGRRTPEQQLALLPAFLGDPSPAVVAEAMNLTGPLGVVKHLDDPALSARYDAWRRKAFGPALDRVGLEPVDGEDPAVASLRLALLGQLGDAKDERVLAWADQIGAAFLQDPASVDATQASWALQLYAERHGDLALRTRLLELSQTASDLRKRGLYRAAAGRVDLPDTRQVLLERALAPEADLSTVIGLTSSAFWKDDEATADADLAWTLAHFDAVAAKVPPHMHNRIVGVGGCSAERVQRAREALAPRLEQVAGLAKRLDDAAQRMQQCTARRAVNAEAARAFLTP